MYTYIKFIIVYTHLLIKYRSYSAKEFSLLFARNQKLNLSFV